MDHCIMFGFCRSRWWLRNRLPIQEIIRDWRDKAARLSIPWRRAWQHTPVFLPGKSHRQTSLVGYSPWGSKESDTTEQLQMRIRDKSGLP